MGKTISKDYLARQFKNYNDKVFRVEETNTYYDLCEAGTEGALNVVKGVADSSTQVLLSDVTKASPDLELTGDGSEYVLRKTDTKTVAKYPLAQNVYTKAQVDKKLENVTTGEIDLSSYAKKEYVDGKTGDLNTLTITDVNTLVEALNKLNASLLGGLVYEGKKILVKDKNGVTKQTLDISPILTDSSIGELKDVALSDLKEGDLLYYDVAETKFKNRPNENAQVLQNAKTYTDEQIAKISTDNIEVVDEKPTLEDAEPNKWYMWQDEDGVWCTTIYVDGTEVTNKKENIDLSNMLEKEDVLSQFTGSFDGIDLTKIPDMSVMKASHEQMKIALGDKVSKTDIVDTLVSEATDAPLSANQGKVLDGKIAVLGTGSQEHIGNGDIHTTKEAKEACANHIADEEIHLSAEQVGKIDEVDNKVDTDIFNQHTSSTDIHMTADERIKWNKVENKVDKTTIVTLTQKEYEELETKDGNVFYNVIDDAPYLKENCYSYAERVIGTWVNGKPLYQKTINFGALPNATNKEIAHNIENVEQIWVNLSGSFIISSSTQTLPLSLPTANTTTQASPFVSTTTIGMWAGSNRTTWTAMITVQYTKTTD